MKEMRKKMLEMATVAKEGHIPSGLSILDILWVLYDKILKIKPKKPDEVNRDIFILSKGHGSLGLYVVLAKKGFFDERELDSFCKYESTLGGHPSKNKVPGVEASTGSLAHGMPMAVGVAMGLKIQNKKSKVFVLIGDGESNEGPVWESALIASHHKLDNLCCIIDQNHSSDRALSLGNLEEKFRSFGWKCIVVDGHDQKQLEKAFGVTHTGHPLVIIANTTKGYGVKSMKNNPEWHHKSPNQEELEILTKELI